VLTFEYPVFCYRQQTDSPIQVTFIAPSAEILSWAGTPRKSDELLTGFQRFLETTRVDQQIVPFFQTPENCSPTAIIVALRSDSGLGRCALTVDDDSNVADLVAGEVKLGNLKIEVDDEKFNSDIIFDAALDYVTDRLAGEEDLEDDADEEDDSGIEDLEENDSDDGESDANIVHLGSETLSRMREMLADENNWKNKDFRHAIIDYVKPAFLIDGQHRVAAGSRLGEKGLPFMICGLYDAAWEEQVFQFTVVNLKPKKIPPSLITSIAALSLSRDEQDRLRSRLRQAGVKMDEVEIMSLVAVDDLSPFAELVEMGIGGSSSQKLGYGAMKRISRVWFTATRNSLTHIAKSGYATNSARKARIEWRTEQTWFRFFCKFWSAIQNHYGLELWQKTEGNRLFIGAHLWALQEALLAKCDGVMPSHWKLSDDAVDELRFNFLEEKMLEVVNTTLAYIPKEIWTIEWTKKSQDTNAGRAELADMFKEVISKGEIQGKIWKDWKKLDWFSAD
jgi:hypothetical protein